LTAKVDKFVKSEWAGNHWPSISIYTDKLDDYDPDLFKSFFDFLCTQYSASMKHDGIHTLFDVPSDRYFADFELFDSQGKMDMDGFQFSIAFENVEIRDRVFDDLSKPESGFVQE